MNECKGGVQQVLRGVAENKRKKQEWGTRMGLVWNWVWAGSGRVEREYIRVVRPLFPHFTKIFLSLPSFESKRSLLSPPFFIFSDEKDGGRRWRGGRPS